VSEVGVDARNVSPHPAGPASGSFQIWRVRIVNLFGVSLGPQLLPRVLTVTAGLALGREYASILQADSRRKASSSSQMSDLRSSTSVLKRRAPPQPEGAPDPFAFTDEEDPADESDVEDDEREDEDELPERPEETAAEPPAPKGHLKKEARATQAEAKQKARAKGFRGADLGGDAPDAEGRATSSCEGGPTHRSPNRSELAWFSMYFTDELLDQVVMQTNNYMQANPSRVSGTLRDTNRGELRSFFVCLLAFSVVDYATVKLAWLRNDPIGLFGNAFLRNTMCYTRFKTLFRCICADVAAWTAHFNQKNQVEWRLGADVCFDDYVDRFMGRPGAEGVKYNPHKEAKRGIGSWRIADRLRFCYYLLWEAEFAASGQGPLGVRIMTEFLSQLQRAPHRTIYLDAGVLGEWESVEKLLEHGHSFIISHASNRPSWLFSDLLHAKGTRPQAHHWTCIGNGTVVAMTYGAKHKKKPVKMVNFTTNLPGLTGASEDPKKLAIVQQYNMHKGYVDQLKAQFNEYSLRH
jgi:hypothetical protein